MRALAVRLALALCVVALFSGDARAEVISDGKVQFLLLPTGGHVCIAIPQWAPEQQPECDQKVLAAIRTRATMVAAETQTVLSAANVAFNAWASMVFVARSVPSDELSQETIDALARRMADTIGGQAASSSSRANGVQVVKIAIDVSASGQDTHASAQVVMADQGTYHLWVFGPKAHEADIDRLASDLLDSMNGVTPVKPATVKAAVDAAKTTSSGSSGSVGTSSGIGGTILLILVLLGWRKQRADQDRKKDHPQKPPPAG